MIKGREKSVLRLQMSQANKIEGQLEEIAQLQKMNNAQAVLIQKLRTKQTGRKPVADAPPHVLSGLAATKLDILANLASEMIGKN